MFYYKGWTQDQTKREIFRVRSRKFTNIKRPHPLPVELGHVTLLALQCVHQLGNGPNFLSRILTVVQISVVSDSLQHHGPQHTRLPCPSPTPGVCSNSCSLSRWCCPTILSSVTPFSSCLQSFPASRSFPMSWLFVSGGQSIGAQLQNQASQWIFRVDFFGTDWSLSGFH